MARYYELSSRRYGPTSPENESAVRGARYDLERYAYATGYNAGFGLAAASRRAAKDASSRLKREETRMKKQKFTRAAIDAQLRAYTRLMGERRQEGEADGERDRAANGGGRYNPRLHF